LHVLDDDPVALVQRGLAAWALALALAVAVAPLVSRAPERAVDKYLSGGARLRPGR